MFKFKNAANLETDYNFLKHSTSIVEALQMVVQNIESLKNVERSLLDLGNKHVELGVTKMHFEVFRTALLFTLEEHLGDKYTMEVKEAWANAFNNVAAVMMTNIDNPKRIHN